MTLLRKLKKCVLFPVLKGTQQTGTPQFLMTHRNFNLKKKLTSLFIEVGAQNLREEGRKSSMNDRW